MWTIRLVAWARCTIRHAMAMAIHFRISNFTQTKFHSNIFEWVTETNVCAPGNEWIFIVYFTATHSQQCKHSVVSFLYTLRFISSVWLAFQTSYTYCYYGNKYIQLSIQKWNGNNCTRIHNIRLETNKNRASCSLLLDSCILRFFHLNSSWSILPAFFFTFWLSYSNDVICWLFDSSVRCSTEICTKHEKKLKKRLFLLLAL